MPARAQTLLERIIQKAARGHCGDPVGTVAFYGPDDQRASKVVVGISPSEAVGISETRKWWSEADDVRNDAQILEQVLTFLSDRNVRSLIVTDGIFGCPHEAGIDFPEDASCEQCPFWKDRERDVGVIG